MADPTPSFDDLFAIGKAEALEVRPTLMFRDGDQTTAVVRGGAAMADYVIGWMAGQIRALLFNGAVGDELDAIILDRMGPEMFRIPSGQAYGIVSLARPGSGAAGVIPAGTQVSIPPDATGASSTYTTDVDLPYDTSSGPWTVAATCSLAGPLGNYASPGGSLNIMDTLTDVTITATTAGFAGGNDAESDAHYLLRAVTHFLTERRATAAALEEGALGADGVTVAHVVENPDTGVTYVRVADDSGESTLEMVYRADVALEDWRAAGVYVEAVGLHAAQLDLVITLVDYADGFDVSQASPDIITSVTNRLAGGRPGQPFTLDEIRIAAGSPYATQIYKMSFGITLDGAAQDATADITPPDGKSIHLRSLSILDGKVPTP